MRELSPTEQERSVTTESKELDKRAVRALTESHPVLANSGEAKGADDLDAVGSHSGSTYTADTRRGSCPYPEIRHNAPDGACKHGRRTECATGTRPSLRTVAL